jgi:predicted MFS family arabinose efflux permease
MEPESPDGPLWSPELRRVLVIAAAWSFAFSTFYLLPKFLEREAGSGPLEIGVAMGIFGWATVLVAPFTGRILDHSSSRAAFLIGTAATCVASLGFLFVDRFGGLLLALRVLQAFSHALVFTAAGVAVAELVRPARLSEALGLSGASMLVMSAFAPAVLEPIATAFGWRAVFAVSALVGAIAVVLSLRLPGGHREPGGRPSGSYLALLRRPLGRDFAIVSAIAGLAFGTVFAFEPTLALSLGRESVGGFFVAYATGAIAVRVGLGRVPDRFGRHRVASVMFALYALAVGSLSFAPAWALEVVGLAFGVAHGLFFPALNGIVLVTVEPHARGRIFGLFTSAFYLGFAGPTVLGSVADAFGLRTVFAIVGATTALGTVLLVSSRALRGSGARVATPGSEPAIAREPLS